MDQHRDSLIKLAADLAPYDDEALASLANKGLVRRARKDLEKQAPRPVDTTDESHSFIVEDHTVALAPSPAQWRCTCHSGVCRHLICAVIFVKEYFAAATTGTATSTPADTPAIQQRATPVATPAKAADTTTTATANQAADQAANQPSAHTPDPAFPQATVTPAARASDQPAEQLAHQILAIPQANIDNWANKAITRKALKLASEGVQTRQGPGWLGLRFPAVNIECKWLANKPMQDMLCSCHAPAPCEHRLGALLAFRAQAAGQTLSAPAANQRSLRGAARTRTQVLQSARKLLSESAALGLGRISNAKAGLLKSLAISANGVDLPYLSRILSTCATEAQLTINRNAGTNSQALLALMARAYALCLALDCQSPSTSAVGTHRSQYRQIAGSVEVACVGARQWETRSGYRGLTVYFWDHSAANFVSWFEARPINQPGSPNPASTYTAPGPWLGFTSPRAALRTRWRLTNLWQNQARRLSGRESTRASKIGPESIATLPAITAFSTLGQVMQKAFPGGIALPSEHDQVVLIEPAHWGPAIFDPLQQALCLPLLDNAQNAVQLRLAYTEQNQTAIKTLEALALVTQPLENQPPNTPMLAPPTRVLGLLRLHDGQFIIEPITIHLPDKSINLTLDPYPPVDPANTAASGPANANINTPPNPATTLTTTPPASPAPATAQPTTPADTNHTDTDQADRANPTDEAPGQTNDESPSEAPNRDDDLEPAIESAKPSHSNIGQLIGQALATLTDIADAGVRAGQNSQATHHEETLKQIATEFKNSGLTTAARALIRLTTLSQAARRDSSTDPTAAGDALLKTAYLLDQAAQAESIISAQELVCV